MRVNATPEMWFHAHIEFDGTGCWRWSGGQDGYENLREQYVTVCRDLIAAHQAAMDARRIADALGYALTNAESDSNGDPVGPELDPAIEAWHQRSWGDS